MVTLRCFLLRFYFMITATGPLAESRRYSLKEPIGTGVSVYARILYDTDVISAMKAGASKDTRPDSIDKIFEKIFKQVQQKFNNISVMININVTKVKKLGQADIRVPFEDISTAVDGRKTLEHLVKTQGEKMRKHGGKQGVVYFFTRSSIYSDTRHGDQVPIQHFEIGTLGTFCSKNTSAAVVMYYEREPEEFHFRAMALIFGSTRYSHFHREDFQYMNKTFSRCQEDAVAGKTG